MTKKRGRLNLMEMEFIRDNLKYYTPEELAEHLNRNKSVVTKFIAEDKLDEIREKGQAAQLTKKLRKRNYYKQLRKQFSKAELLFFEEQWCEYFMQFNEDVTHTEEMQIIEVVRTEVLINRSMEDRRRIIDQQAEIEQLIEDEMAKPPASRDLNILTNLQAQLGALIGSKSSYVVEHEKLLTKKEKYLRDLKGTREQRKKIADDAKTNFILWLRQLDDLDTREAEGYDMEVQSIAADKARRNLSQPHEYVDGALDYPLLNSDTVKNDRATS